MDMELRVHDAELRANEDGTMTVSGYVNKTEQLSNVLGATKRFVEKIAKGAFSRAIQNSTRDIDFLAEHKRELILASTRNSSLELNEDEQGLFMSATITPTSWGKDYYELIKSGIHRSMSFGFRTVKDNWKLVGQDLYERTIEELELFEVSVVKDPAYSQSTISARGIDLVEDVEIPDEIEKENRQLEEFQRTIKAIEERVNVLIDSVQELRTFTEQKNEETRDLLTSKVNESDKEADKGSEKDSEDKEEKSDEDTSKDIEKKEDEETKDEEDSKEDAKEDKSEDEEEQKSDDEETEQERSLKINTELSEMRSRLLTLK